MPDAAELFAACRQELIPYEVPAEVPVVDEWPRGPSVKVSGPGLLALFTGDLPPISGADRATVDLSTTSMAFSERGTLPPR